MYPYINIFGSNVSVYDICFVLSFATIAIAAALLRPENFPLKRIQLFFLAILLFFSAAIGAQLLHIILNSERYRGMPVDKILSTSGAAFLGAPLLAFLVLWIFCINKRMPFLLVVDYIIPFFALDRVIGRFGCLMHGCCYGIPSNLPWAYPFWDDVPKHTTQAYALVSALAIFAASRYLYKRLRNVHGITFFYVVLSYCVLRFFNEFLRAEGPFVYGPVKLSHITLCIFSVIAAAGLYIIIKRSPEKSKISKVLKEAVIRLSIWFVSAGIVALLILSFVPKG